MRRIFINNSNQMSYIIFSLILIIIFLSIDIGFLIKNESNVTIHDGPAILFSEQEQNQEPTLAWNVYSTQIETVGRSNGNIKVSNISLALFFSPTCPCSQDAFDELDKVAAKISDFELISYNISIYENKLKMIDFMEAYNVPPNIRLDTPFLFVGDYYLHHYGVTYENVSKILLKYRNITVPLWPSWEPAWTIHIAFFYNPEVEYYGSLNDIIDQIKYTWNSEIDHVIIHEYSFANQTNSLLFEAYFSVFNLSMNTSYQDPSEIFAGVFIGDCYFLNQEINYQQVNATISNNSGQNVPLKNIRPNITGGDICILFFRSVTCGTCDTARTILENLKAKYPELDVKEYNIGVPENLILQHSYFDYYDVPTKDRGTLGVFIGDSYFVADDVEDGNFKADLEEQIRRYEMGCDCPDVDADKDVVKEEFSSFTVLAVLAAGLVDSINPCAIATLIFFIGYLSATGRTKKQVLIIGMAYTLGIFITYMVLGLGLYSIISTASNELEILSQGLYPTMAIITFIFGFYSIYDYKKAQVGKKDEMKLQLPKTVKSLIGRVIKEQVKLRYFAMIAIVTGVIISTLEFLCTGQVYLPTIVVVVRTVPEFQGQAVLLLFLYNLMFILPLIIIFSAVYRGMSSEQLQVKLDKNRAIFKLLTAMVFFALGAILLWYSLEILI